MGLGSLPTPKNISYEAMANMFTTPSSKLKDGEHNMEINGGGGRGFMLFGVRLMEGSSSTSTSFRKSASMINLAQFDQPNESNLDVTAGYESDDVVHPSGRSRERKRGVAWSEEEHRLFLLGLQRVGKGDWRGISRNFVNTRTPTQVASHAQKYFLRRSTHNTRRRRRSSLFDITITTEPVLGKTIEDQSNKHEPSSKPPRQHQNLKGFQIPSLTLNLTPLVFPNENSMEINHKPSSQNLIPPTPILPMPPPPPSSKTEDINLNNTNPNLLNLSTSSSSSSSNSDDQSPSARRLSSFQPLMPSSFNSGSGDSIIIVA